MMDISNYESYFEAAKNKLRQVYLNDCRPWIVGYSGGKDSTLLLYLIFEVVASIPEEQRNKTVYAVTSDTMLENPIIKSYMHDSSNKINEVSNHNKLNIVGQIIYPNSDSTFWSKLIGNGYPTPEPPGFRWCTTRLKIQPMNRFVNSLIEANGDVIILLGVRKGESELRKRNISKREIEGKLLIPHTDIRNAYVFNPLTEIPNEVVWKYLLKNNRKTPWGVKTDFLFSLYQGQDFNEEQSFIAEVDDKKISSTGSSRFGCWCCTFVKEDKSLNSFIEKGSKELLPLRDFREFLMSIRNNPKFREKKRANGTIYTTVNGKQGLGPFTLDTRCLILEKLLDLQKETGYELITLEELKYIQDKWELEGDLSRRLLPDIYYSVFGRKVPWDSFKTPLFDIKTIDAIKRMCKDEDISYELICKLLMSINKNKKYYKGEKLKKDFAKLLNQDWVHKDIFDEVNKNED